MAAKREPAFDNQPRVDGRLIWPESFARVRQGIMDVVIHARVDPNRNVGTRSHKPRTWITQERQLRSVTISCVLARPVRPVTSEDLASSTHVRARAAFDRLPFGLKRQHPVGAERFGEIAGHRHHPRRGVEVQLDPGGR